MGGGDQAKGPQTPAGSHLVQVVVGLGLLQAEGLPELGGQPGQQLVEDVVVPLVFGLWSGLGAAERGAADLGDPRTHIQAQLCPQVQVHTRASGETGAPCDE